MRAAGLFLFIGAVGFFNFYDGLVSDDEAEEAIAVGSDRQNLMKLQKKFGVKERRSIQQQQQHLARSFDQLSEELLEHYRMPLSMLDRHPIDCRNSTPSSACSCLRLLCFGGSACTAGDAREEGPKRRLRERQEFVRCRQTSMDGFLLCECKNYRWL